MALPRSSALPDPDPNQPTPIYRAVSGPSSSKRTVLVQDLLERMARSQGRIRLRQLFEAAARKEELDLEGSLAPEGAVVVKGRDPIGRWHEIGTARPGNPFDKVHDRSARS